MGVKYRIEFKTIKEKHCEVLLDDKNYTGAIRDLMAGGEPFRIDTDTSGLLNPIRSSSATLSVFGSDYLQDLYTSDPQGVKVTLKIDGNIHWIGYLTPDTFSQNFTDPEFIYEMECVSALSTLKYKDFDLTSGFVSFLEIIKKARDYAGYNDLYLTNETLASDVPWYNLKISSANFYDELGEAMTYYEVLEEIAKYLGLTIVPYEDDLYFLDYFAIKKDFISYSRIVGDTISGTLERDTKSVEDYKGTGTKLSRISGKNKAVVNCSLYEVDNDVIEYNDKFSTFNYKVDKDINIKNGKRHFMLRMYDVPEYTFFRYKKEGSGLVLTESTGKALKEDIIGSGFARKTSWDVTDEKGAPSRLSFEDVMIVRSFTGSYPTSLLERVGREDKILNAKSKRIISAPGSYFALYFSIELKLGDWYQDVPDGREINGTFNTRVELRVGDLYYNGVSWTTTKTTFFVDLVDKSTGEVEVKDTNSWEAGMPELTGRMIPVPEQVITGDVELTLYHHDLRIFGDIATATKYSYYKDIRLSYSTPDPNSIYGDWVSKDSKNDLIYENVIDDDFIEPADEIDLKICTRPDGKVGLACVLDGSVFLEKITSKVFGTDIAENILLKKVIELYKKPRFVIDPVLENNAKPFTVFTEPHLNKEFMNAGGEENVKMESTRFNLIEM